ncbi:hypothetical protein PMIN06_004364 [Paraphaeosphaeria minitans]
MATYSQLIGFPISVNSISQYSKIFHIHFNASLSIGRSVKTSRSLLKTSFSGSFSGEENVRYFEGLPLSYGARSGLKQTCSTTSPCSSRTRAIMLLKLCVFMYAGRGSRVANVESR